METCVLWSAAFRYFLCLSTSTITHHPVRGAPETTPNATKTTPSATNNVTGRKIGFALLSISFFWGIYKNAAFLSSRRHPNSSYVTTKLYGTSTCGCINNSIFLEITIFTFLTGVVCGHGGLAAAKPWWFMPKWKDGSTVEFIIFRVQFNISFCPSLVSNSIIILQTSRITRLRSIIISTCISAFYFLESLF